MSDVKRYGVKFYIPQPDGKTEYVLASDYDALASELAEAMLAIERQQALRDDWCEQYTKARDDRDRLRAALERIGDSSGGAAAEYVTQVDRGDYWKSEAIRLRLLAREALRGADQGRKDAKVG